MAIAASLAHLHVSDSILLHNGHGYSLGYHAIPIFIVLSAARNGRASGFSICGGLGLTMVGSSAAEGAMIIGLCSFSL